MLTQASQFTTQWSQKRRRVVYADDPLTLESNTQIADEIANALMKWAKAEGVTSVTH